MRAASRLRRPALLAQTDGGTEPAADPPAPVPPETTLIAHRGFAGENPENTRAAMRAATCGEEPSRRADAVEIDVVPTAGGDVVVFHDDELAGRDEMGLTDTEGIVWETDTETVTSAEVLQSGETVPRLTELLEAVPTDVGINVELKNPGSSSLRFGEKLSGDALETQTALWRPFVTRVLSIVDEIPHEILFSSFYEAALAVVSEQSTYPLAPVLWDSVEDGLAIAQAYDAVAIHPPLAMISGTPFFDDSRFGDVDILEMARADDCAVNVWTVESWFQAQQLVDRGVDGLIADYSTLLRELTRDVCSVD